MTARKKHGSRRRTPSRGGSHRLERPASRLRATRLAVVTVLAVIGLGGIWGGLQASSEPPSPGSDQRGELEGADTGRSRGPALTHSEPARLDIPSVGIHTSLLHLGLNPDDTLEVPSRPMQAGWYAGSPTPGERGPSIISGHVDSAETGPAVFHRLGDVSPGDRIDVTREDGSVASFEVTAVRSFAKNDFPTQTVYGNTANASLRLITCGRWNVTTREYDGNIVVFAQLGVPEA